MYDCTSCNPWARPDRKPARPQTRYAQFADTLADLSTAMPEPVIGPVLSFVRMKHTYQKHRYAASPFDYQAKCVSHHIKPFCCLVLDSPQNTAPNQGRLDPK